MYNQCSPAERLSRNQKKRQGTLDSFLRALQWLTWLFPEWTENKSVWRGHPRALRAVLTLLALFYVGLPVAFYLCPWIRRAAVFLPFLDWPLQTLSKPEYYGLNCTRHFFVETSPGIFLGVWHVPPSGSCWTSLFSDSRPVVLYLHGSAESRSAPYRRSMYKVLSGEPLRAHVITFDYRGFGDSTWVSPTANTLEEDAAGMYSWLQKRVPTSRIVVWGHSMGSGIAARLAKRPGVSLAVVFEAPFTSIADATRTFPLSFFHRRLPLFETFCSERTRHPDTNLDTLDIIGDIQDPLLILHAADDSMVWSEQGRRLWERAVQVRSPHLHRPVFVEFNKRFKCGHRNIHKVPHLSATVADFLQSIEEHKKREMCGE
ncbi:lysophosphatidylserine lipase ABHD12 [Caerostris darwini]|uniref:Lysophosphatidylserine lipase ABHD12 n=1 Tax=Caerostris darwini TaxID=1538125 RepID=A0AAV4QTE8_9ARAC|nr:lysophosphatidylserine lipase ABHD12 [Caerostris darwini]